MILARHAISALVCGLACGVPAAFSATLIHDYQLNGSWEDLFGGPAMTSGGGLLGPNGYKFTAEVDPNNGDMISQGPSLSGGLDNLQRRNYSIEIYFRLDDTTFWKKLVDFKNLTDDNGFYNYNGHLQFDSQTPSDDLVIQPNTMVEMVITRDVTGQFKAYTDGVLRYEFRDTEQWAVFNGPDNIMWLFEDDTTTLGYEAPSGWLDFVRVYEGALTAEEVLALYLAIPEPATGWLVLAGGAGWFLRRRARR